MADASVNASTHAHVVAINAGHHGAIVRMQERLVARDRECNQLELLLRDAVQMLADPDEYTAQDRWGFINHVRSDGWAA